VPLVARVPDHAPEAVQVVALVEVQVSVAAVPLGTMLGLAPRLTVGAGALATVTVVAEFAEPPGPLHVSVNVLMLVSAPLTCEPLVATVPDHAPDAVHAVAFALLQVNVVVSPLLIVPGLALRDTVGAGATVTVADADPEPPGPVQVSV